MLTGRGISLLVGAALAWVAGRTLGIAELYAVSVAAGALVGLGVLYVRTTTSAVSIRRTLDTDRIVAGGPLRSSLELRNDGHVPSPTLLVTEGIPDAMSVAGRRDGGPPRFVLAGLGAGRQVQAPCDLVATTRGRYTVGPASVLVRDPFGVAERRRRYSATADVVVYPRIEVIGETPVRGSHMTSGAADNRQVTSTGEEFYTMREYVRGDDLRQVHWPTTARRQTLMVRQMEQPWQAHATLLLDTRRVSHSMGRDGTFEKAVSVAASLVYHLADAGYRLRLLTEGDVGRATPTPWEAAMDRLAVVQSSEHPGLGPSLATTRGAEGLFVAVLGVPSGAGVLSSHPDLRALYGVRGFGHRVAIVVGERGRPRAQETSALLRSSGWQAATLAPSDSLAGVWADLTRRRARHGSGVV